MKSKIIILLIGLMLTALSFFGQNPGYLGKTVSADYTIGNFPSVGLSSSTGKSINFAWVHTFSVTKTLKRNFSMGVHYTVSNPEIRMRNTYGNYNSSVYESKEVSFNSKFFGIDFQFYRRNYIAPVGTYFNLGYSFGIFGLNDKVELDYSDLDDKDIVVYSTSKYNCHKLTVGIQNRRVLTGGLYLTAGLSVNAVFGDELYTRNNVPTGSSSGAQGQARYHMSRRVRWDNFMNFQLGMGFIIL